MIRTGTCWGAMIMWCWYLSYKGDYVCVICGDMCVIEICGTICEWHMCLYICICIVCFRELVMFCDGLLNWTLWWKLWFGLELWKRIVVSFEESWLYWNFESGDWFWVKWDFVEFYGIVMIDWFFLFHWIGHLRFPYFFKLVSYCMDLKKRFMKWFLYCDLFWKRRGFIKWFYDFYYYWVIRRYWRLW